MLYHLYEFQHASLAPARIAIDTMEELFRNPYLPVAYTGFGRAVVAACEVAERITRRYGKPEFGLATTRIDGREVAVEEEEVLCRRFCTLLHFKRDIRRDDPKVLVVAPLSGHYATLLRGTVEALLPNHDVYITDWVNARDVPAAAGPFGLDDYIEYLMEFIEVIGPGTHVLAVCQPSVPVLAAVALMNEDDSPAAPATMTLMGGPVDTRVAPTEVSRLAEGRTIDWFERNVISRVPIHYPGFLRRVYPGFMQLTGFMTMNLDRHVGAHIDLFNHLVEGDGESAAAHRAFYDEYMSVMDMPAEYYLETVKAVFMDHTLPKGRLTWRARKVNPPAIRRTALMTVEGERDDISAVGWTAAAHDLCASLPKRKRRHRVEPKVGHYGIFNGRRWRENICPDVSDFIRAHR